MFASLPPTKDSSDAVKHEPSGFLSDTQRPGNFAGTDTILGIGDEPHTGEPLLQTQRGVFEDSSNLRGKLPLGMGALALPLFLSGEEGYVLAATGWANDNTIGPSLHSHEFKAVIDIGEVNDCLLKCLRCLHRIYTKEINLICQLYNYRMFGPLVKSKDPAFGRVLLVFLSSSILPN
jgi:hypothetical protein